MEIIVGFKRIVNIRHDSKFHQQLIPKINSPNRNKYHVIWWLLGFIAISAKTQEKT